MRRDATQTHAVAESGDVGDPKKTLTEKLHSNRRGRDWAILRAMGFFPGHYLRLGKATCPPPKRRPLTPVPKPPDA